MGLLDDLLAIPTIDEVIDGEILPAMRSAKDPAGNPTPLSVTAWSPLDPWRIATYIVATLRRSDRIAIATRTAAGFFDYVFGFAPAPAGVSLAGWDRLRATSWYGINGIGDANGGTYTRRRITLTNTSASSYGPLAQGKLIIQSTTTGNRYIQDDDAVTIPGSGSVQVIFRSEYQVDSASGRTYADATGSTWTMINAAYPGVTATNPAPTYSDVAQVGSGLGTLVPSNNPNADYDVQLRIDSTGVIGAGTWSANVDGGGWVSQSTIGTIANLNNFSGSPTDITITPNNNGGNFIAGTIYRFTSPGTDVVSLGRDAETPQELGNRCRANWPMLAFAKDANGTWIPGSATLTAYEALARAASDQVKICYAKTGSYGLVTVYVAGQGAVLDSGTVAALQAFFNAYSFLTDNVTVASPSTQAVTLGGASIGTVPALTAKAKAAMQTAVRNYLTGVDANNPLGVGDGSTVKVQHAYLVKLMREAVGVTSVTDTALTINGVAADLTLPAGYIATYSGDVATSLTWS